MHIKRLAIITLILAALIGEFHPSQSASAAPIVRPNFWVPNNTVFTSKLVGTTLYIGGSFNYIGPATGQLMASDAATSARIADFPTANGVVNVLISDGAGGFYVGGNFTQIGGLPRNRIARILANNTVDPAFSFDVDGEVRALLLNGTTLYVGGRFNQINGQSRSALASINVATKTLNNWVNIFSLSSIGTPSVDALAIDGTTLYVGGRFDSVNIIFLNNNIAAVHAINSAQAITWNIDTNGRVRAIALNPDTNEMFIGGDFSTVTDGTFDTPTFSANRLAQITMAPFSVGNKTWNPAISGPYVHSLLLVGNTLYIGGLFNNVLGQSRFGLAAVNATTETLLDWNPNTGGEVYSMVNTGNTLYITGSFIQVGGQIRRYTAAVNTGTGLPEGWTTTLNSEGRAIAISDGKVAVGGIFSSGGGVLRNGAAALSTITGAPLDWNPSVTAAGNYSVRALMYHNNAVYLGGEFSHVGGQARTNIASVDATTGAVSSWNPVANNVVYDFEKDATKLYVGGAFNNISGQSRFGLAAYTLNNNLLDPLSIALSGGVVYDVLLSGSTIYIGGTFNNIAGSTRNRAAAINASGVLQAWNPNVTGTVYALAISGSRVFIGGAITQIGGINRDNLGSVNATTGVLDLWNPGANGTIHDLDFTASGLYVSGEFSQIGLQTRQRFALINTNSGVVGAISLNLIATGVFEANIVGNWLYLSGSMYDAGSSNALLLAYSEALATQETIGVFRSTSQTYLLRNANSAGAVTLQIKFGVSTDIPLVGDWNGDGVKTPGIWRPSNATFYLSNQAAANPIPAAVNHTFAFGVAGDIPVAGDWDGDGKDSIGVFRPTQKKFYLRNALSAGAADYTVTFGLNGDTPLAGDWNGDGVDSPGVWRPSNKTFFVTNIVCASCSAGVIASAAFGLAGDLPFVGDWDGNGTTGIGVFRPSNATMYLRNTVTAGAPNFTFAYGLNGDRPVAGRWAVGPVFDPAPESAPSFVPKQ